MPKKPDRPKSSHYNSSTYKETSGNLNETGANSRNSSRDFPPTNDGQTSPSSENTVGKPVDSQSISQNGLDITTNISAKVLPTKHNNNRDFKETKPMNKNVSLAINKHHLETKKHREKRKNCENPADGHKHKRRKHSRDAQFEGHRISHLVKKRTFRKEESEDNSSEGQKKSDDYVLARLFKKSGRYPHHLCCICPGIFVDFFFFFYYYSFSVLFRHPQCDAT